MCVCACDCRPVSAMSLQMYDNLNIYTLVCSPTILYDACNKISILCSERKLDVTLHFQNSVESVEICECLMTQAEGAVGEVSVIDCDSFIGEVQMFMIVVQCSNVPGSTSTLHLTGEH